MKRMKLPNGYGSIVKLAGRRRNPYMVRPPVKRWNEKGQPIYDKAIGYYKTWQEAYRALQEYNDDPLAYEKKDFTFAEVWAMARAERAKSVTPGTLRVYDASYNRLQTLQNAHIRDLRLAHIQQAVDDISGSLSARKMALVVVKITYDYAVRFEIVKTDYSSRVRVRGKDTTESHQPFTQDELDTLKSHAGDPVVDMILIMCYSGFRVAAFQDLEVDTEQMLFRGGVKTRAGKDRVVPIHPALVPMLSHIDRRTTATIRNQMRAKLEELGLQHHTPHDCRHTFSWLCDQSGMQPFTKKKLIGHAGGDITDKVYGHRTLDELREAVEKIVF